MLGIYIYQALKRFKPNTAAVLAHSTYHYGSGLMNEKVENPNSNVSVAEKLHLKTALVKI